MMHYRKGENVEQELTKDDLPFDDCIPKGQRDFLWMHVKGGTKVSNVITYAKNALEKGEHRTLVWSGSGGGVVKTVSCAEIIKRSFPLYQVTRMDYTSTEEHWKPQMEGLEEIVVRREIPTLHILMSLDVIDVSDVQKPNTKTDFWPDQPSNSNQGRENTGQRRGQQQQNFRGRSNQKKKNHRQNDRQNPEQQQEQQQEKQQQQQQQQQPQHQQRKQHQQQQNQSQKQQYTQKQNKNQQQQKPQQEQEPKQQTQQHQNSPDAPSSSQNVGNKTEKSKPKYKKPKKTPTKSNPPEPMET